MWHLFLAARAILICEPSFRKQSKMRSFWKTSAAIAVCAAAIAGIGFGWCAYKAHAKLAEAARLTRQRAERGDAQAESDLSGMYYYGRGVPQSYVDAANWVRKAADQGYARAQYRLGYLYTYGQGVPKDYATALQWYRKAADQNYADAQCEIGRLYYYGAGVAQNYTEAARWYRMAADQGSAAGQDSLGIAYSHGNGVPQDYAEAFRLFRKAADQGNAKAEYNLGRMYYFGYGVPQDRADAARWLNKAAAQGDEYALSTTRANLTTLGRGSLLLQLIAGLFFALGFLPIRLNHFAEEPRLPLTRSQKVTAGAGVLLFLATAYAWYGYSHLKFQRLAYGPNTWVVGRWLSVAAVISLFFYSVRLDRKREAEDQLGVGSPEQK